MLEGMGLCPQTDLEPGAGGPLAARSGNALVPATTGLVHSSQLVPILCRPQSLQKCLNHLQLLLCKLLFNVCHLLLCSLHCQISSDPPGIWITKTAADLDSIIILDLEISGENFLSLRLTIHLVFWKSPDPCELLINSQQPTANRSYNKV